MNLIKFKPLFLLISLILIIASITSIVFWGFKPSIDFIGGSVWELNLPSKPDTSAINSIFNQNELDSPTIITNDDNYLIQFPDISLDQKQLLVTGVKNLDPDFQELKFEATGPSLGKELLKKTIIAIILSCLTILLFIASRFHDFHFGLAAIVALLHDCVVLMGTFSVLGHFFGAEFNALFVTALLTTLSLSVYDTVVIFDRIRELKYKNLKLDWGYLGNQAIVESLTRSINTSATTIFTLIALVLLGGSTTRWFATALLVGIVSGTYSSIGVAIPLVLFFKKHFRKK
jgi:preprotein translocase subunit SecF